MTLPHSRRESIPHARCRSPVRSDSADDEGEVDATDTDGHRLQPADACHGARAVGTASAGGSLDPGVAGDDDADDLAGTRPGATKRAGSDDLSANLPRGLLHW